MYAVWSATVNADFACLSKKCRQDDGSSPVYELPVGSRVCPKCASKRIQQLFNNPNVIARGTKPEPNWKLTSNSHFVRSTALLQPGFDEADARRPPKDFRTFAMNARDAAGFLQGKAQPMDEMTQRRYVEQDRRQFGQLVEMPSVLHALNRTPIPTTALRDPRGE